MTDHHIHIGQFNEIYYDALELFQVMYLEAAHANYVRESAGR